MKQALNDYQAQLITAIVGVVVVILVTAVPQLQPYQDNLTQIIMILVGLIVGQSIQKHGK